MVLGKLQLEGYVENPLEVLGVTPPSQFASLHARCEIVFAFRLDKQRRLADAASVGSEQPRRPVPREIVAHAQVI